jgi:hypothetical protein
MARKMRPSQRFAFEAKPWEPPPGFRLPPGETAQRCAALTRRTWTDPYNNSMRLRCQWAAQTGSPWCYLHAKPEARQAYGEVQLDKRADNDYQPKLSESLREWAAEGPTIEAPLPPAACRITNPSGLPCDNPALPGTDLCHRHSTVRELIRTERTPALRETLERRAALEDTVRAQLLATAAEAVDTVTELMRDSPPGVRLRAAQDVLDRAGLAKKTVSESHVTVEDITVDPLAGVLSRLAEIRERIGTPDHGALTEGAHVYTGEVVAEA